MNPGGKSKLIGSLLIFTASVLGVFAYTQVPGAESTQIESHPAQSPPPMVMASAIYDIPLADDKVLMGASHNVFVGKVLSQIGTTGASIGGGRTFPVSQFSVEPIFNIKGSLSGTVTVEQTGGYQGGALMVSEDGDMFGPSNKPGAGYLLQPGSTYLLSTRYQNNGDYYLWAFPTAAKLISTDSNLGDAQLQSLAANDERVQQLEAAYPHEILVADDVHTGNTRNSWISLHTPPPAPPPPPAAPSSTPAAPTSTSQLGR